MNCPICGSKSLKTTNTRPTKSGAQTWRRKECMTCHCAITTDEKPDMGWLSVRQAAKNKTTLYRKSILLRSLINAFSDEELAEIDIDSMLDTIELKIVSNRTTIIDDSALLKIVLNTIKPISLSAYMRYLAEHSSPQNQRQLNSLIKSI